MAIQAHILRLVGRDPVHEGQHAKDDDPGKFGKVICKQSGLPGVSSKHRLEDGYSLYRFRKVLAEQWSALWFGVSCFQASLSS
jgi:hypothetical protein